MLYADAYCFVVPGAVLENIPLHGVVGRQRRTVLCHSPRALCALDGAISQARVQKIRAEECTRMEVRVSCVEKRRISQRTVTYANKMVGLAPCLPLVFGLTNEQLPDGSIAATLLGTGREAGADEDDFHLIRRRNMEIDRDEREQAKSLQAVAATSVVKASGRTSVKPKKMVYF